MVRYKVVYWDDSEKEERIFKGYKKRLIAQHRFIILKPGKALLKYRPEIPAQEAHNKELHDRIDRKERKNSDPRHEQRRELSLISAGTQHHGHPSPAEYGRPAARRGGA